MNISQPVVSSIESVDFAFLDSEQVRRLSVKRIGNPIALDSFLHPVPGGLYDLALGAFQDNLCATCHLNTHACPGHCGHIDLPTHVYHCTYVEQIYRLLRAQCVFCGRFRLARVELEWYCGYLRLINRGLIQEAKELEEIGLRKDDPEESDASMSSDEGGDEIIRKRKSFVSTCLKEMRKRRRENSPALQTEAITEARKEIVGTFQASIIKTRRCHHCKGVSPTYRKNGAESMWRKPVNGKDRAHNVQNGHTSVKNALQEFNKIRNAQKAKEEKMRITGQQRFEAELDEGVADLESRSSQDELAEHMQPSDEGEGEDLEHTEDSENESEDAMESNELDHAKSKKNKDDNEERRPTYLSAAEVHASLTRLFQLEREILSLVYAPNAKEPPSADMFFIKELLVPPNRYRPEQKSGPEGVSEPPENGAYRDILGASADIRQILQEIRGQPAEGRKVLRTFDDLQRSSVRLQGLVNTLIDSDKSPVKGAAALRVPEGIKQKLEKKEGIFRMFIMGKRVNFAARSVISPDPNIETNEIGVPPVFAKKLTYPEPVTIHNYDDLKEAVKNGADTWPGAIAIENENGQIINLRSKNYEERTAIANLLLAPSGSTATGMRNKKVHRHLHNGDVVIMNRQPTLHKPSMMTHRAKVLPGEKTIRMHYANCKTYNADFDGDEMNMHFPQNEIARAEALQIANTDNQYLSATAGEPLRGLIQDHISISVWLTCQGTTFGKEDYQELLYSCLRPEDDHTSSGKIMLVDPAILRPVSRWTGKQVVETILLNIKPKGHALLSFESKSSVPKERWGPDSDEGLVRFEKGQYLSGIMDKKQIGPSTGGLVHCVYEAYGNVVAGKLLGILGRLLTKLLNMRAFSCGVEDLVLTKAGDDNRKQELASADALGIQVASKYVSLHDRNPHSTDPELLKRLESVLREEQKQAGLDLLMNGATVDLSSKITKATLPGGLRKDFPSNQMQTMTVSGAKGSAVNANLISCNLGQQVLEGRRVPVMVSGKTLPSFKPFESHIRAGGYITDRFLTGVRPQEYFFHAMAGREGLIDTAVKTARSGYLQRCLVKGLEGLHAEHDASVRDSDGTVVQTLYGEDGLDIVRQTKLTDFSFLGKNYQSVVTSLKLRETVQSFGKDNLYKQNRKIIKAAEQDKPQDPLMSLYSPSSHPGSTSEVYCKALSNYIKRDPDGIFQATEIDEDHESDEEGPKPSKRNFPTILNLNYLKSVVQAGEAVGVVAAQSIGEPSTQMTLNTFHLAGHAAKNVTLGIPRLREILMTASVNIKTPIMSLYPIEEMEKAEIDLFAKSITRLTLGELVDKVTVTERDGAERNGAECRLYEIQMELYPADEYKREYAVTAEEILSGIQGQFLKELIKSAKTEFKKRAAMKSLKKVSPDDAAPTVGQSAGRVREEAARDEAELEGGTSDIESDGEGDATAAKRKANADEGVTYDEPDSEDEEVIREAGRQASPEAIDEEREVSERNAKTSHNEETDADDSDEDGLSQKSKRKDRESHLQSSYEEVFAFEFDDRHGSFCNIQLRFPKHASKILMLPLVNRAIRKTLIHSIPGLGLAKTSTEPDPFPGSSLESSIPKVPVVHTEGVNLTAAWGFDHVINPHRILTNDIAHMLKYYGVEAARSTIIRELRGVFDGHGISVDLRHLTLIGDYMTRNGGFQAFSRMGMKDKSSPFAKMSFETTMGFLRDAVLNGEVEQLTGPSARITVGKIGKMGTGKFDVLMPYT